MNLTETVTPLHLLLAAAVLTTAIAALYVPRRLTAVVLFLVFGVLLSAYWAVLGAPDVALAEAVIGTGVTGALFGYVATALPGVRASARPRWGRAVVGVLGGTGLGAGLAWLLTRASLSGNGSESSDGSTALGAPGLAEQTTQAMPATGVEHPITGVLLNLRSYDTLMEMVVLLAAVAVALAFLRDDATPRGHGQSRDGQDSSPSLVSLYVKIVAPVALLLAAWLLFAGSSQPGGAFQAGAAVAAVMILLQTSTLRTFTVGPVMVSVLVIGVVAFLTVALGGLVLGDAWLLLRGPWAGTVTVVLETVLAVSIGASLAVVFMATTVDRSRSAKSSENLDSSAAATSPVSPGSAEQPEAREVPDA